jgi:hypothetical protein
MAEKEKNPLVENNLRAMEYIWQQVPKEIKDGVEYITYVKGDIPYLYYSGLVDTNRFTLPMWEKAFEDVLGEDGRYWVPHKKLLWLGQFRYSRTLNEPFDPLKMREGKYSPDRLWKVFENSIIPSSSLPKEFFKNTYDALIRQHKSFDDLFAKDLNKLKEEGKEIKDLEIAKITFEQDEVMVSREVLVRLRQLLDTYPSPRRKMEMSVHSMRNEKLQELADVAKNPQKSKFEAGPDFRETAKKSLKDMLVKASEDVTGGRKPSGEVFDLKAAQKSKRPPGKL